MTNNYEKHTRIQFLVKELNRHCDLYYNQNAPEVSDAEYDAMFDELAALEKETGLIMSNSPTQRVGAQVVSALEKLKHQIPLLSLDKTKDFDELSKFVGGREALLMLKMDGLTIKLEYDNGELQRASTRGDGDIGEDITHNAKVFKNIPLTIPHTGQLVVTGEAVILDGDFEVLQATTVGSDGKPYRNARNLAAGSVRQLDANESAKRKLRFIAFNVLDGFKDASVAIDSGWPCAIDTNSKLSMLRGLKGLGFDVVFYQLLNMGDLTSTAANLEDLASKMKAYAAKHELPIDGLVASFNDVAYSKSLGRTGHHYRDGMAFKYEDEKVETVLRDSEWNVSRSGELAGVAIFDTVELDGTEVSRASLHNLDFIANLNLQIGDRILVSKRNMIIPHIEDNLSKGTNRWAPKSIYPECCPSCGSEIYTSEPDEDGKGAAMFCTNDDCPGRKLKQLVHFTGKKAMDIDGLAESTLEQLLKAGLVQCEADLYELYTKKAALRSLEGFGDRAVKKLLDAIEKSKNTTMEKFIISMDIPELGRHASAILCKAFDYDFAKIERLLIGGYDFTVLEDFGDTLNKNIYEWFADEGNVSKWLHISRLMNFVIPQKAAAPADTGNPFFGKTIVATGTFESFTRDSINSAIESLGAKAGSSVSGKTDFVIAGEKAGSKKKKAEDLGVRVLSEAEFREMAGL